MDYYSINKKEERKDKFKSGIITAIIWSVLLLFVFLYKIVHVIPKQNEVVSAMLINFGDNRNGNGEEEPANQEGSLAATAEPQNPEPVAQPNQENAEPEVLVKKENVKEKILTGNNEKTSVKKTEKTDVSPKTSTPKKNTAPKNPTTNTKTGATTANSTTGNGDGKGTAAIGNLLKGRGSKTGTQGNGGTIGNAGDPLGGDSNGDSKIGVDRKLVGFIPGTMGRGGAQPSHNCSASGSITISYTVDKAGNVVSARRSSGVSDACVVSTTIAWVKKYVKAEKANFSSTGTYQITF